MRTIFYSLLLAGLLLATALAQVRVTLAPRPEAVLQPYGVTAVGQYQMDACASSVDEVLLPQHVRQAVHMKITLLTAESARAVIESNAGRTKTARTVEILSYALLGVPALGGTKWISAHPQWVQGLSTGTGIAMQFQSSLRAKIRDLSPLFAADFSGPMQIRAHSCETRTMFAGKMAKPPRLEVVIPSGGAQ